jgi:hypothetical protein
MTGEPRDLYLDLLKRALTDTIFASEPDIEKRSRFINDFIAHYIKGRAVSMVPLVRMDNVRRCAVDVIEKGVPGDFIETGVWRGGLTIFLRGILAAYGDRARRVWVADSFEGLPPPDPEKTPLEAKAHVGQVMTDTYKHFAVGIEEVQENFKRFGLLDDQVVFLKGWFKDTLPTAPIERLALARLDGDYYQSTIDALTSLYPKLSPGGYLIVDDYGEDTWTNCRRAVDEYRQASGILQPLIRVDAKCYFWQK